MGAFKPYRVSSANEDISVQVKVWINFWINTSTRCHQYKTNTDVADTGDNKLVCIV